MIKNENAFSLIEVIIATSIITITIFWVYKLIWENTKIISNSSNYLQSNSLFPVIEECIEKIWFNTFKSIWSSSYHFNFWNATNLDDCNIGSTFNVTIDNIDYYLLWNITNSWSDFIEWQISISSDEIKTITWNYKQLK